MNRLLEKGMLRELACGDNFAYVLMDNELFLPTEYKVLQSQSGAGFVRCMKMLYNGRIQLYYMVSELKTLPAIVRRLDTGDFFTVVRNIFADVIAARSNGFLSCQNIVISFDKIFVNQDDLTVSLVYVPVKEHLFDDYAACENQLRSDLVQLISSMAFAAESVVKLSYDLSNREISFDEIYQRLGGDRKEEARREEKGSGTVGIRFSPNWNKNAKASVSYYEEPKTEPSLIYHEEPKTKPEKKPVPPKPPVTPTPVYTPTVPPYVPGASSPSLSFRPAADLGPAPSKTVAPTGPAKPMLRLVYTRGGTGEAFRVNKDFFLIGNAPGSCDGLIANNTVNPSHCCINRTGAGFTVTDLGSRSGTLLNGRKLQPNMPQPIRHGDILLVGNFEFQLLIAKEGM